MQKENQRVSSELTALTQECSRAESVVNDLNEKLDNAN